MGERPDRRSSAEAFVEAWRSSRSATFEASGSFERRGPDGLLEVPVAVVQSPPHRMYAHGDQTRRTPTSSPVGCESARCRAELDAYAAIVDYETASVAELVLGPGPVYGVSARGDCFELRRLRFEPRLPWGPQAEICFDRTTGAVRSITVDHGDVIERTVYDQISAEISMRVGAA